MKKFLILLAVFATIGISAFLNQSLVQKYYHQAFFYSYCSEPIAYRIDTVDPEFNLSKEKFIEYSKQATEIWNDSYGKTLFVYDPAGNLSVNLVYDERQRLNTEISKLETTVKSQQQNLKPQVAQYEKDSTALKQKIEQLNQEIQDWNTKGGAPPEEYEKLIQRQKELQQEADNLNETAKNLNLTADAYNTQVSALNKTIDTFGQALQLRPEEGIFLGPENKIEVYFYNGQQSLVHTLTHEFGHALGIDHNNNIASVMYPKTTKALKLSEEDTAALIEVCKDRSKFELLQQRIQQLLQPTQSS